MMIEHFPQEIFEFLLSIEKLGFSLCAVGGLPRDFFYSNSIGTDFDFEIRPLAAITVNEWPLYYKKLHHFLLEKNIAYTELPYLITRASFLGLHFEFSSPRLEKNLTNNKTHHHFEATLDPNLSFEMSFKRRDFTINSIGITFQFSQKTEVIVDPYKGLEDLKIGLLKNINDYFFADSVRFLRLIRFKIKFAKFIIDEELMTNLTRFDLSELSSFHFTEELFKSNPSQFLNLFSEIVKSRKLKLPNEFLFWTHYKFPPNLETREEILAFVFSQNPIEAEHIQNFFSLPGKKLKELKSFLASYNAVKALTETDFKKLLELPMELALESNLLKDLKNLEEKKDWKKILKIKDEDVLLGWNDWVTELPSIEELNQLKPIGRSYYKFYKAVKKKFS